MDECHEPCGALIFLYFVFYYNTKTECKTNIDFSYWITWDSAKLMENMNRIFKKNFFFLNHFTFTSTISTWSELWPQQTQILL